VRNANRTEQTTAHPFRTEAQYGPRAGESAPGLVGQEKVSHQKEFVEIRFIDVNIRGAPPRVVRNEEAIEKVSAEG
jgi:hypothetical protein